MRIPRAFLVLPLAALALGLLFSSQRAGQGGDEQESLAVLGLPPRLDYSALLVDERNPKRMYAQSDEGVLATRDGGVEWVPVPTPAPDVVRGLQPRVRSADPTDPERVLERGPVLRLSTDAGETWRTVLEASGGVTAVAWSPSEPGAAYAIGGDAQLYRSDDAGVTWLVAG